MFTRAGSRDRLSDNGRPESLPNPATDLWGTIERWFSPAIRRREASEVGLDDLSQVSIANQLNARKALPLLPNSRSVPVLETRRAQWYTPKLVPVEDVSFVATTESSQITPVDKYLPSPLFAPLAHSATPGGTWTTWIEGCRGPSPLVKKASDRLEPLRRGVQPARDSDFTEFLHRPRPSLLGVSARPHTKSDDTSYRGHCSRLFASNFAGGASSWTRSRLHGITRDLSGSVEGRARRAERERLYEMYNQRPEARTLRCLTRLYASLIQACDNNQRGRSPTIVRPDNADQTLVSGPLRCAEVVPFVGSMTSVTCPMNEEIISDDSDQPVCNFITKPSESSSNLGVETQWELSPFLSRTVLDPRELEPLLTRISHVMCATDAAMVVSLIYIDRLLILKPYLVVAYSNLARLLPVAILLAIKFLDDVSRSNAAYASAVLLPELNLLEAHFLKLIDYRVFVADALYREYCYILQTFEGPPLQEDGDDCSVIDHPGSHGNGQWCETCQQAPLNELI